jgi:hypothetical protein
VELERIDARPPFPFGASAPARRLAISAWLAREGPLVAVVGVFAAFVLSQLGRLIQTDTWLGLVAGRVITKTGLPSRDTLTLWTAGKRWIDQQWLAHVLLYRLDLAGGPRLLVLVHVVVVIVTFAAATIIARRRGGTPRSVAAIAVLALAPIAFASLQVRPEAFAYLLFVALVAMLSSRAEFTWRRAAAVVALLVLWANLHGSVVLAAALVVLYAGLAIIRQVRGRTWPVIPGVLALASVAAPFASPYALTLPHYYSATLFEPAFGRYLAQWQPTTLSVVSLPVFLLAGVTLRQFGRTRASYSAFEVLAAIALLVAALLAMRNWVWFSLFAVMILPRGIGRGWEANAREGRLDRRLALAVIAGVCFLTLTGFSHAERWYTSRYSPRAAEAVARVTAADPNAKVFATIASADWLLWVHPELAGRIAYDVRYELMQPETLRQMLLFRATGIGLRSKLERYDVLVLSRFADKRPLVALRSFGNQIAYRYSDDQFVVVSLRKQSRA